MLLWQDEKKNYEGEEEEAVGEKVKTEGGNSSLRDMWNIQTDRQTDGRTCHLMDSLFNFQIARTQMFWFDSDSGRLLHAVKLNSLTAIAAVGCTKGHNFILHTQFRKNSFIYRCLCTHTNGVGGWVGGGVICLAGT